MQMRECVQARFSHEKHMHQFAVIRHKRREAGVSGVFYFKPQHSLGIFHTHFGHGVYRSIEPVVAIFGRFGVPPMLAAPEQRGQDKCAQSDRSAREPALSPAPHFRQ
jgi:hypothetical protein